MNNAQSVREAHEAFVSGHSGSTPQDIILAVYPAIPASVAAAVVGQRCPGWFGLLIECLLLVLPLTLSLTCLANYALELSTLLICIAGVAVFFISTKSNSAHDTGKKRLRYLSVLRSHLNLVAGTAILAVDFQSFPRRFVKTEEYGYSLMDLGAAGFVINNGIVEGRKRPSNKTVMRDSAILTALGVLRFLLVRATDYQHHVTEYGTHANFFFTLAFVKIFCSWWLWRLNCIQSLALSAIISVCHQTYLVIGNGAAWTLSDIPRDTLISANREWIVAMPGYITVYLLGGAIGDYLFNKSSYKLGSNKTSSLFQLTLLSLVVWVALHNFVDLPSRRLANPTFVYFVACFLLMVLTHYALIESIFNQLFPGFCCMPVTSEAINQQPMLYFLLSNVATGLINKSINTLDIMYPVDLLIVTSYGLGLVGLLTYLHVSKRKQKTL